MDKKTVNKQKIMEKSIHVLYLKGYSATGVKDLTEAAGIPKGSFYYYFKTKEAYALEALKYYIDTMGHESFSLLEQLDVDPLDRVRNFYKCKIENMKNENYKFGCLVGNLSQELGDVNDEISEATNRILGEVSERILKCILEAEVVFGFKPLLEPSLLADAIVNSWQGALVRMKSSRNSRPLDEFYKVMDEVFLNDKFI